MTTTHFKSFHYLENGEVSFSMFDTIKSNKQLDPGSYKLSYIGYPENKVELKSSTDKERIRVYNFADKEQLDDLFNSFFKTTILNKITNLGFHHKVGILLYGKEGTGKSSILKYYYSNAINSNNAIVFHMLCSDTNIKKCWDFICDIRKIQDNPIIVVFEEFDEQIQNKNESFIKSIMDGNMSINNCIFMATTNYIDTIPEAMKKRPSRFKYVLNIKGVTDKSDIYLILQELLSDTFSNDVIHTFVDILEGKSLDFIKQFCIDKLLSLKTYDSNISDKSPISFKK